MSSNHHLSIVVEEILEEPGECDYSHKPDKELCRLVVGGKPVHVWIERLVDFIKTKDKEMKRANGHAPDEGIQFLDDPSSALA